MKVFKGASHARYEVDTTNRQKFPRVGRDNNSYINEVNMKTDIDAFNVEKNDIDAFNVERNDLIVKTNNFNVKRDDSKIDEFNFDASVEEINIEETNENQNEPFEKEVRVEVFIEHNIKR